MEILGAFNLRRNNLSQVSHLGGTKSSQFCIENLSYVIPIVFISHGLQKQIYQWWFKNFYFIVNHKNPNPIVILPFEANNTIEPPLADYFNPN